MKIVLGILFVILLVVVIVEILKKKLTVADVAAEAKKVIGEVKTEAAKEVGKAAGAGIVKKAEDVFAKAGMTDGNHKLEDKDVKADK